MTTMWIRVKKDGFIYPYDDILAKNPDCEVVAEQVAFPHKFITPEVNEAIVRHTPVPEVNDDLDQQLAAAVAAPALAPAPAAAKEPRPRGRPKKDAAPKSGLNLSTDVIPEPPAYNPPELAQDASRGLP